MARFNFEGKPPLEKQEVICPLTLTQNVIAGRWKVIILWHLSQRTIRFNEFQRCLPGISKGILTRQLRELEDDGMVHREVYKEVPPKVEYSLTELGKRFIPILDAMEVWGKEFMEIKLVEHNYYISK
ncbi:winged helix-turn-helix transcriptional regulator [Metabacillus arenae]|uniref:Helix-turn-helix transcriptional regulator n=1 Tax=Metabacillus arenae TaxID=2771434 RepID=A0A926NED9_9BACI|nr:helix-turn-helix domain-containing protein [Metabacillus arenae]MBD1381959.1 helix-turn-helix transcriptional regulator [Metabacillus arenae]